MNNQEPLKRQIAIEVISFLFILLFVYAGVTKLMDLEKFRIQIGQSPLLTEIAGTVAWLVPTSEIFVALLLSTSRFRLHGLMLSVILMVMFATYIFVIVNFSEHVPCSCGGVLQRMKWTDHLIFNITFVILASFGVVLQFIENRNSPDAKNILLQ